ncbi:MAG: AMP-binding protein [Trueperaceae bacterium]
MIVDLAHKRAQLAPRRPAVRFDGRWHDYGELDLRAGRLAGRLAEAGLAKGDRVAILAHNHIAHIDLLLATAKLGVIYTPFNHRLVEREQAALAAYVRPALLLYDEPNGGKARAVASGHPMPLRSLTAHEEWLDSSPGPPSVTELDPEDTQMILFTGGTTGTPKGAMLPYRQGLCNAANTVFSWGLREDDCVIQATPCFHAALNAFTVPLLFLGARVVLQETFDPGEYLGLVEAQGATVLFMVPTMYQMLIGHSAFSEADLSTVRWAISGGAPCPEPVRAAFDERGIRFRQGYGLTEAGVNCFAIDLDDAAENPLSVGHPIFDSEAVIRDSEGEPVPPGEVGELTLRGGHLFSGYFEKPAATAEVLRNGWLWTGDLARQDDAGRFYLVGRRKEMFISGGENVFPAEIENVLYSHPAVSECTVLAVSDDRWGEVGLAAIVLRQQHRLSTEEAEAFLRSRLAGYKVPKHIHFLEALPKSGAGKILKQEIARWFLEGGQSAAS